jgi:hypothetical protein
LALCCARRWICSRCGTASPRPWASRRPAKHYGPIRLLLVEASIVIDCLKHELIIPSGAASGLKIGGGLSLRDGGATTITVDFDGARPIRFAPGCGYMAAVGDVIDVSSPEPADRDARVDASQGDERTPGNTARPEGVAGASAEPAPPNQRNCLPRSVLN